MRESLDNAESRARFAEVMFVGEDDQICPAIFSHEWIAERHTSFSAMCRKIWGPTATAALYDLVGQYLGYEDQEVAMRQCRRWARGESEPSQSILWMLVASKEGWRVVRYISNGASWRDGLDYQLQLAALARNIFGQLEAVIKQ